MGMNENEDELLDQSRVAAILGTTEKFLEARRVRGGSIPFCKIGSLVRYKKSDVWAYIESRRVLSTGATSVR